MLTRMVNGVVQPLSSTEEAATLVEWGAWQPGPDVPGFTAALKAAMGGIVASNALAKSYPLFHPALGAGNFPDVQALIIDAHASGVLSDPQYKAFQSLAAQYRLPITLP